MKRILIESAGLTLMELILVIAIVGILSTVAYPLYSNSVMQSRRIDAISTLQQLQMAQEKYRAYNPSYSKDLSNLPVRTVDGGFVSNEGLYTIDILEGGAYTFKISATAMVGASQESDSCRVFTITQDGPLVESEEVLRCWSF